MKLNKEITKGNFLDKKGITLIALVVTIVVLLILAGVSINALFGNNGIISKAKDAQNKMDEAQNSDLDAINILTNEIDKITDNGKTSKTATLYGLGTDPLIVYAGESIYNEVNKLKDEDSNDELLQLSGITKWCIRDIDRGFYILIKNNKIANLAEEIIEENQKYVFYWCLGTSYCEENENLNDIVNICYIKVTNIGDSDNIQKDPWPEGQYIYLAKEIENMKHIIDTYAISPWIKGYTGQGIKLGNTYVAALYEKEMLSSKADYYQSIYVIDEESKLIDIREKTTNNATYNFIRYISPSSSTKSETQKYIQNYIQEQIQNEKIKIEQQ